MEAKVAAENAEAAIKTEREVSRVMVNKRTGKPLYIPQPLRSSACLYKEARINNVSYDKMVRVNPDTISSSGSIFNTNGGFNGIPTPSINYVTVILSILAVGGFVEGFVLFSKTSATPSPTSALAYPQEIDVGVKKVKALHETGYSPSTIKLIKDALNEQSRRRNDGLLITR